jgi:YggT family protein
MVYVVLALRLLSYLIIADALLSWVQPSRERFPRKFTARITDPIYAPIHRILDPRKTGGLDLAPLVVLLGIQALSSLLSRFAFF